MTTENTSSTKILIIEDEIAIAEGLIDLCKLNGYIVKHCADGESGLAEALTGQYNLVLLDLMLPGILPHANSKVQSVTAIMLV